MSFGGAAHRPRHAGADPSGTRWR